MVVIPNQNDVLFGRGTPINNHPGNQYFRLIVDESRAFFADKPNKPNRKQRRESAEQIVNRIHQVGGRFLVEVKEVKDDTSSSNVGVNSDESQIHPHILAKSWVVVGKDQVMLKVLHRLREKDAIDEYRARSVQAEHKKYENGSIPGVSQHLTPIVLSPMMMMHYEAWRSLDRINQFLDRGGSVGPATMTSTMTSTMTRNENLGGNDTLSTSQLKESDDLDITQGSVSASSLAALSAATAMVALSTTVTANACTISPEDNAVSPMLSLPSPPKKTRRTSYEASNRPLQRAKGQGGLRSGSCTSYDARYR